jgi:hypothetical protein
MVVDKPSFFSVGTPITEFGAIRIVSSPRTRSTRPVRPVRIVSPGFSVFSGFSDACCHTSPEDLLTDQTPSSAAIALAPAASTTTIASAPRIPIDENMLFLGCSPSGPRISKNVSRED